MFNNFNDSICLDFDLLLLEKVKAIIHTIDANFMPVTLAYVVTSHSSLK